MENDCRDPFRDGGESQRFKGLKFGVIFYLFLPKNKMVKQRRRSELRGEKSEMTRAEKRRLK